MTAVKKVTKISSMNIPLLLSTKGYNKKSLKHDIIAGLLVTALAVPELMGIAALAGVPVQMGLYSALLAPLVFALFGVSRRLIVGADSATAMLLAGGAGALAATGSATYINIVLALGLMSALLLGIIAVCKLTFLADLISRPVMVGFLAGVGTQLMVSKLPEMLGLSIHGTPAFVLTELSTKLVHSNGMAATITVLVVGLVLILRQSRVPGALIGLFAAAGFAALFNVAANGVAMVGKLPLGLPHVVFPFVPAADLVSLLPIAFSITLVIIAQSTTVIRSNADMHDEKVNIKRDILALSLSGLVSAVTSGLAINASPPRTYAADAAGMRSQVASVVMSICIAILLLVAGGIFAYVPVAALAAIVFLMGLRLVRWREIIYLARHHKMEFAIAMAAFIGVVVFGVFNGIVFAVTVSLMERLRREYHPSDDILLRDGQLSEWAKERIVGLQKIPDDMLVFGFDASLFFENVQYFSHRLRKAIRGAKKPLRSVIVDTSAMDDIDYTAVEQLKQSYRHLSADGITLGFSHVSPHLMRQFAEYGVIDLVGRHNIYTTLRSAIEYVPPPHRTVAERVLELEIPNDQCVVVGGAVMEALNLRESAVIDLVVSREIFARFASDPEWTQPSARGGRAVYAKNGIWIMRSWQGRSIATIKRSGVFTKNGVSFMDLAQLITCKQRLGRKKDQSDISQLKAQLLRDRSDS